MEETEYPTYSLSLDLVEKIKSRYKEKFSVFPEQDKSLVDAIQWASDFYINNPSAESPWQKLEFEKAYLSYYLPKNILRLMGVVSRLKQVSFFDDGIERIVEWGSGNGAFDIAMEHSSLKFPEYVFVERSKDAIQEHQYFSNTKNAEWFNEWNIKARETDLLVFSYSLTELDSLPAWIFNFSNILIVEPSTQQDGRRLMSWREDFLREDFNIWAPCTHSESCPLLDSKTDWCHDNFQVNYPDYLESMKSKLKLSLSRPATSYLAIRKHQKVFSDNVIRVVGNTLKERGKTRQLVCRSSQREFFSWFSKREQVPLIPRGSLLELTEEPIKKSNELRLGDKFKHYG